MADMNKNTKSIDVKTIVKEALYSKSGSDSFHSGNPFAIAFNKALNEVNNSPS